ncbi:MAG: L,D-transpeptidase family protein [Methyloligellaceae bacterium]
MVKHILSALILGASIVIQSAAFAIEPDAPEELVTPLDGISMYIQKDLEAPFRTSNPEYRLHRGALVSFYSGRNYNPVWTSEKGLTERAYLAMEEIRRADDYGLSADIYELPQNISFSGSDEFAPAQIARAELQMSFALLAYARHAVGGRIDPNSLRSKYIDQQPEWKDPVDVMKAMVDGDIKAYLADLHPKHPQFLALMKELRNQREVRQTTQLVRLPKGPTLKPGMRHPHVALLRERLEVDEPFNDDGEAADENIFDDELADAVRAFQKEKGLTVDAIVGPSTKRNLNGTQKDRIKTIIANLERWRWMPRDLGKMHIRVNIPEYRFRIMSDNNIVHEERVVTGKTTNQTPIFSDKMETVVFNPYWYPPKSIIQNEILPGARVNPNFVSKKGFQVSNSRGQQVNPTSVNWNKAKPGKIFFRQPPGPRNALGEIKFLFPNKHAVYMHDTPTKYLFKRDVRAYSHGCIRVRDPRRLAEIILGHDANWSKRQIGGAIAAGQNRKVTLQNKIPVHVSYFTAWVDESGQTRYGHDVYGHDRKIWAAYSGRPIPRDPADPKAIAEQRRAAARKAQQSQPQNLQSLFATIFNND